jgi:tetratricopeptide (TPR) repeat protein
MNEERIAEIESLKDAGEYDAAIRKIRESIGSADCDVDRARYLINLVVCATNSDQDEMARDAIEQLYRLPLPADLEPIRNYIAGVSHLDFDRPQQASELFQINIDNPILLADEFAHERYENLVQYGFALVYLGRYLEALSSFNQAELVCPKGNLWADIQLYRISSLGSLGRFDEAFLLAQDLSGTEPADVSVRAKYHMAEIRLEQGRFSDALRFYREVQKLLPSSRVLATDVKKGIERALNGTTGHAGMLQ